MNEHEFNPNDAPPGFRAVPETTCRGCVFQRSVHGTHMGCNRPHPQKTLNRCGSFNRKDRTSAIFVKRKLEDGIPELP